MGGKNEDVQSDAGDETVGWVSVKPRQRYGNVHKLTGVGGVLSCLEIEFSFYHPYNSGYWDRSAFALGYSQAIGLFPTREARRPELSVPHASVALEGRKRRIQYDRYRRDP